MIIKLILAPFWLLIDTIIKLIPDSNFQLPIQWADEAMLLLSRGMAIFPVDVWLIFIGNVIFWLSVHLAWAMIEWVYKKVPGVS